MIENGGQKEDKAASNFLQKKRAEQFDKRIIKDVVKKFRPSKSDKGKVVFLAVKPKKGKKFEKLKETARRLSVPVYVNNRGKVIPVKEFEKKRDKGKSEQKGKVVQTVKPINFDATGAKAGKRKLPKGAIKKWQSVFSTFSGASMFAADNGTDWRKAGWNEQIKVRPEKGNESVDWLKLSKILADKLDKGMDSITDKFKLTLWVKMTVTYETQDGRIYTSDPMDISAHVSRGQWKNGYVPNWTHWAMTKLYAYISQAMADNGEFYSHGSYEYIKSLSNNKGKSRSKWTDKNGNAWSKRDLPLENRVNIKQVDFIIGKQKIISKDENPF